jgi:colanic acid biosynthesis glycosyl transferase WcaI
VSTNVNRVWFVSELFYPEETSTGYFLTRLAEHLAGSFPTSAICAQPSYSKRGIVAPSREKHRGVDIHRFRGTTFRKDNLIGRVINILTINVAVFFYCLRLFKRGDRVLVVTNPPLLPFVVAPVCWLKGAKCVLRVEDVYPDALVASGFAKPGSLLVRLWNAVARWFYNRFDHIIVLGRDMENVIAERASTPVQIICNWADNQDVKPLTRQQNPIVCETGLANCFVVQYAGNMGRTHDMEILIAAAKLLNNETDIHFLLSGWGAKRAWLENASTECPNVTVLPHQPRERLPYLLTACDVSVISLMPGMSGISVPSRLYNVLAAGRPVIAIVDEDSEIARVIREEHVGWVVKPRDVEGFALAVREASQQGSKLVQMGERARTVAEQKYSFAASAQDYVELFATL